MEKERFVELYNGERMPKIGLGTGKIIAPEEIENTIDKALELGYRHFDTATSYRNEAGIGKVFQKWIGSQRIVRDELFVVTKLPLIGMHVDKVGHFVDLSLQNLQVSVIDLYLIHWPVGLTFVDDTELFPRDKDGELLLDLDTNLEAIWKVMESQVIAGKIKSIGLSNFNVEQIRRILKVCRIRPAVLQVELHVNFQQNNLRELCSQNQIAICGFAPLGSPGRRNYINANALNIPRLLEDSIVTKIGLLHGKSPAQILIHYLLESLGIAVIPKSMSPDRLEENLNVFDFELSPNEVIELRELDQGETGRSFQAFDGAKAHPECPF